MCEDDANPNPEPDQAIVEAARPPCADADEADDDDDGSEETLAYWTPERMARAQPRAMPVHPDDPTSEDE